MGNNPTESQDCSVIIAQPVPLFRYLKTYCPLEGQSVEIVANTFFPLKIDGTHSYNDQQLFKYPIANSLQKSCPASRVSCANSRENNKFLNLVTRMLNFNHLKECMFSFIWCFGDNTKKLNTMGNKTIINNFR